MDWWYSVASFHGVCCCSLGQPFTTLRSSTWLLVISTSGAKTGNAGACTDPSGLHGIGIKMSAVTVGV